MIILSRMIDRQPHGDQPIAVLLQRAMQTPETFKPPKDHEFCSACGDWRPRSYFALNPAFKRGVAYECKQCKNALDRKRREIAAFEQGRELRAYRKRAA